MDAQTKRTLAATALCLLLLFGWIKIQQMYAPPQPIPSATEPAEPSSSNPMTAAPTSTPEGGATADGTPGPVIPSGTPTADLMPLGGLSTQTVALGDDHQNDKRAGFINPYKFAVVVSPVGASIESVRLSEHRSHVARNPRNPDYAPYELLRQVIDPITGSVYRSFTTERLRLVDARKDVELGGLAWTLKKATDDKGEAAVLTADIQEAGGTAYRIVKTIRIEKGSPQLKITYQVENHTSRAQKIRLTEGGPIGFEREDLRYDHVRAMTAIVDDQGRIRVGDKITRIEVVKLPDRRHDFVSVEPEHTVWSAVSNKYFTCISAPRPAAGAPSLFAPYLDQLFATAHVTSQEAESDMTVVQAFAPRDAIPPGGQAVMTIDAYCGPKSDSVFDAIPEAKTLHYTLTMAPDRSGCTFDVINTAMLWLLSHIHAVVRNYGIAIIILVIIVRAILHPISKKGQINMMRMQKNMSRIKPKLEQIQDQFKNDKQKLNEETMKLYREEGVNPAGSMLGCLPMFLQMPIWVALYTSLNTTVDLRHAPFFGYIRDLSSPDTLIDFHTAYNIPIIGFLMGGPISALNLLPIIMTALMYGQQKLTQKLTKPDKPPTPKLDKDGNPLPDTMAQQQKMMSFMMIFMGFIFYNMPSGLCLYILCSSLLGMVEQWYIRRHIKEQEIRGELERGAAVPGAAKPAKSGWLARKYADLQKIAEQQRLAQARGQAPSGKRKKHRP